MKRGKENSDIRVIRLAKAFFKVKEFIFLFINKIIYNEIISNYFRTIIKFPSHIVKEHLCDLKFVAMFKPCNILSIILWNIIKTNIQR